MKKLLGKKISGYLREANFVKIESKMKKFDKKKHLSSRSQNARNKR